MKPITVEFKRAGKKFRTVIKGANGEKLVWSETYERRGSAKKVWDIIAQAVVTNRFNVVDETKKPKLKRTR